MNLDFSNGEERGKKIAYMDASSKFVKATDKDKNPSHASFQLVGSNDFGTV
eukprot:Awhi_evm2s956